jgi:hypothetical protein
MKLLFTFVFGLTLAVGLEAFSQQTVFVGQFTGNGTGVTNVNAIQAANLAPGTIVTNPAITVNNGPSLMVSNNSAAWGEIVAVNGSAAASSDLTAQADKGTALTNYINLGINNSGYAQASSPVGQPFDTYLISAGQNMFLDVIGLGKSLFITSQTTTNAAVLTNVIFNASGVTLPNGLVLTGNGSGLTNLTALVVTNSPNGFLTSTLARTVAATGLLNVSVVVTNNTVVWLTNLTSHVMVPMGNTTGVWTNYDNAVMWCNSGDSVLVTNVSGSFSPGYALTSSFYQVVH